MARARGAQHEHRTRSSARRRAGRALHFHSARPFPTRVLTLCCSVLVEWHRKRAFSCRAVFTTCSLCTLRVPERLRRRLLWLSRACNQDYLQPTQGRPDGRQPTEPGARVWCPGPCRRHSTSRWPPSHCPNPHTPPDPASGTSALKSTRGIVELCVVLAAKRIQASTAASIPSESVSGQPTPNVARRGHTKPCEGGAWWRWRAEQVRPSLGSGVRLGLVAPSR